MRADLSLLAWLVRQRWFWSRSLLRYPLSWTRISLANACYAEAHYHVTEEQS